MDWDCIMYSIIPQLIVNSLITSAELAMIGLGLTICFDILKFANFAHTEMAMLGAYLVYFFNVELHFNLAISIFAAAIITGFFGILMDRAVFKRMRKMGDAVLMITSLGLAIVMRNTVRVIWGPGVKVYDVELSGGIMFLGARITPAQIWILSIVIVAMVGFYLMLKKTKIGKAMRATSDNSPFAEACSIDTEQVILLVWFIGGAFAGLGGAMIGWDTQIDPMMGFMVAIPVFCVVLMGGIGNVYGLILASLILGFLQNCLIFIDFGKVLNLGGLLDLVDNLFIPVDYKPAIAFFALIIVLLFKPLGIMGAKQRK